MKRKVLILIVLIISILLVGCTNQNNENNNDEVIKEGQALMDKALLKMKENDKEGIKEVFGKDTEIANIREYFSLLFPYFDDMNQKDLEDKMYEKMFDRTDINVDDRQMEDGNWYIYFTIKNLDMSKISTDSLKEMYDQILSDDEKLEEGYENDELYNLYIDKILSNMEKDDYLGEYYQKATITKEGNSTIINADSDTFINGLLGNILENGEKFTKEMEIINDNFEKRLDEKLNSMEN